MRTIKSLLSAFAIIIGTHLSANATLFTSLSSMPAAFSSVTVTPYDGFIGSCSTSGGNCQGNTTGTGPNDLSLTTQTTWLNANSGFPVTATGGTQVGGPLTVNNGTFTSSTPQQIWTVHGDSWYLAFYFATAITSFTIGSLPNAISGVYAFNPVPLPPALLLFASGLIGLTLLQHRRQQAA